MSDGTPAATRLVPAIPGLAVLDGRELRIAAGAGGAFVLIGGVDEYGNRTGEATLYWTDGDLPPRELAVVPLGPGIEYAVFVGDGRGAFLLGPELWYSDGTVAGTRQLRSFSQQGFAAAGLLLGGKLHFVSRQDGAFPSLSLAVSDGTPGGTQDYYEDPRWSAGGGPISLVIRRRRRLLLHRVPRRRRRPDLAQRRDGGRHRWWQWTWRTCSSRGS